MLELCRNLRYALRLFRRSPGFAATVVLTLGVGIGASSAVFSSIDAVLLRPLPFPEPDRLVLVTQIEEGSAERGIAPVRLEDWHRASDTFESLTGWTVEDASDTTGELPERVRRAEVGPRFLATWGVAPALGRDFTAEEHTPGGPRAILISDRYWRTRLGADPNVLERTLEINGVRFPVVGVMPPTFTFPGVGVELWTPDWSVAGIPPGSQRFLAWYTGVGRLKPGVTIEQARADLAVVQARLAAEFPQSDASVTPHVEPLKQAVVARASAPLWALFGAVTLLLLIACTNVASLLLARAAQREHEVAVRYSLGASRRALIAQLLAEASVLAVAGALLGLSVAAGGAAAFAAYAQEIPRAGDVGFDWRVAAYTAAATVLVALLCGALPAVRFARESHALARSGRGQVAPRHSVQWALVGAQVALSVTLLAGAGVLLRSFDALSRVDPGFEPARVLTFRISADWAETQDYDGVVQRLNTTIDELAALPGVESVATAALLPGIPGEYAVELEVVEGGATDERLRVEQRAVSPEYFATLAIPVLAGDLCRRPTARAGGVDVMVNRSFVERYFPGRSPIGLQLARDGVPPSRIVGVVGDARERGLDRPSTPTVYPCFSAPTVFPWFVVRPVDEPERAAASIRARVRELEPLRAVYEIAPLEARIGDAHAQGRLLTVLLGAFGTVALALVCLGVYGTLSYVVGLRRREVGLRIALGALGANVVGHFLGRALAIVGVACGAGLLLWFASARMLAGLLYGVTPLDPATLCVTVAAVLACAALAALSPALRAARVEPMRALREE